MTLRASGVKGVVRITVPVVDQISYDLDTTVPCRFLKSIPHILLFRYNIYLSFLRWNGIGTSRFRFLIASILRFFQKYDDDDVQIYTPNNDTFNKTKNFNFFVKSLYSLSLSLTLTHSNFSHSLFKDFFWSFSDFLQKIVSFSSHSLSKWFTKAHPTTPFKSFSSEYSNSLCSHGSSPWSSSLQFWRSPSSFSRDTAFSPRYSPRSFFTCIFLNLRLFLPESSVLERWQRMWPHHPHLFVVIWLPIRINSWIERTKRVAFLRGINLGGGCKLPTLPSPQFLYDSKTSQLSLNVSFVGRPIPLDTLSSHLARIRAYGFTILRLLVTWEAVEPTRPGVYDLEFLKYFRQVVMECHRHSISVFVDPHQDVWSRFTGGSVRYVRARSARISIISLKQHTLSLSLSHRALQHGHLKQSVLTWLYSTRLRVLWHLKSFQRQRRQRCMVTRHIRRWYVSGQNTHPYHSIRTPTETQVWGTNYNRLATATMFTLFFAGDRFAPNFPRLKNKKKKMLTIQQYLQSHYIDAMKRTWCLSAKRENFNQITFLVLLREYHFQHSNYVYYSLIAQENTWIQTLEHRCGTRDSRSSECVRIWHTERAISGLGM